MKFHRAPTVHARAVSGIQRQGRVITCLINNGRLLVFKTQVDVYDTDHDTIHSSSTAHTEYNKHPGFN